MNLFITENIDSANSIVDIRPYVYGISWTELDAHYIGARAANKVPATQDLWVDYFTSSKTVTQYREQHGEPDRIVVFDTFDTSSDAFEIEKEILEAIRLHGMWHSLLNRHTGFGFDVKGKIPWNKGRVTPLETKLKLSAAQKRVTLTDETKAKIAKGRTGKKHSEETRSKMSDAQYRRWAIEERI